MTILVAHPSEDVRRLMRDTLDGVGFQPLQAADADEALALCREHRPEVVIVAADLCRQEATELLSAIKTDPDLFSTPVIVHTESAELPDVLEALRSGVHDFLVEPVTPAELVARVEAARRTKGLADLALSRLEDLESLVYLDALTQLYNRRYLERQLHTQMARADRHSRPLSVAMLDLDHFKAINDSFGHVGGDEVLLALARRLRGRLREEDSLGRWGGEEFLVLLPEIDAAGAHAVAESLRCEIAATPIDLDGRPVAVTTSVGWATWEGESSVDLVARADAALYEAKAQGRNRVVGAPATTSP